MQALIVELILFYIHNILGVEDTGLFTTEQHLTNNCSYCFVRSLVRSFLFSFVLYCFTSTVSSTPRKDTNLSRMPLEANIQLKHSNIILHFPFDDIEEEVMLILILFIICLAP